MPAAPRSKLGPCAAIAGALLLFVGTYLHPMEADPNVPLAAFSEYAADRHWIASHLIQLLGIASMVAALVLLSRRMADGIALLIDGRYPKWLGACAIAGGVPTVIAGFVIARTGFSGAAMAINLPASSLLLVWMIGLGLVGWRRSAL